MQLNVLAENQNFIVLNKPAGLTTHQSSAREWGFIEWASEKLSQKLFVIHRLDRDTSGLLMVAKSSAAAAELSEKWEARAVKKTYLFLTKGKVSFIEKSHKSFIDKAGKIFTSNVKATPNSETHFTHLNTEGGVSLWQAEPITGKPHQIRLHAHDLGLSILGDNLYQGGPFCRLCLHAWKLEIPSLDFSLKTDPPSYFFNLSECNDSLICKLTDSLYRRSSIYRLDSENECLRLAHTEDDPIRIDKFGPQYWIYNYSGNVNGNVNGLSLGEKLATLISPAIERQMLNRGERPQGSQLQKTTGASDIWQAEENGIRYELRSDAGLSPGLFLDQRENRAWVRAQSTGRRTLNLFSYTGGFSLAAALGGAEQVTTVDVSRNFIEWSKRNFELNGLTTTDYEFWAFESQEFLKICSKKNRNFDLIICDPPSLARNKSGVFRIEKDLPQLIKSMWSGLAPNGILFVSTNFEKWNQEEFEQLVAKPVIGGFSFMKLPMPGLDYEVESRPRLLKAVAIKKH